MVNERGAQFWRYLFEIESPGQETPRQVFIYDHSEIDARKQIEKIWNLKEAVLLAREPW